MALLGAAMCWDNKDRAFGFMKDTFANATDKQLSHCPSSMRTNNNHICIEFQSLIQNCFYRSASHIKGCCIQTRLAQSF